MRAKILLFCFTLLHFGAGLDNEPNPISTVRDEYTEVYPVFTTDATERGKIQFHQLLILDRTLYIGASEQIFLIDLDTSYTDTIDNSKAVTWKADTAEEENCKMKGKSEDECQNHIKVLIKRNDDTLLICGTNAYHPSCRHYKVTTMEPEGDDIQGSGKCPYDPKDGNAALFADDHLYSATVSDFPGRDPLIYRSLGNKPRLRTVKSDSRWLKEPYFVHAVDYGNYIYFFFRETSVEYHGVGTVTVSRVARVCKNDMGGNAAVLEKEWTSFLKARLACTVPGDPPFDFNTLTSVTDVFHIGDRDFVVAAFSTPKNSIPGSAVCTFAMDDIDKAFAGSFKEQKSAVSLWTTVPDFEMPTPRPGPCAGSGSLAEYASSNDIPDDTLVFLRTHVLMAESVDTVGHQPWFLRTKFRDILSKIAVDSTAGPKEDHTVVFVGSNEGKVLKLLASKTDSVFQEDLVFLEEMSIYNHQKCNNMGEDVKRIVSLQLDKPGFALYVAFPHCVIRVPLGSCERHGPCKKACIASRDPYCGWANEACIHLSPGTTVEYEQDIEFGKTDDLEDC